MYKDYNFCYWLTNCFALTQLLAPFDYPCDRYFKLYDEGKKQPEYIEMSLKYKVIIYLLCHVDLACNSSVKQNTVQQDLPDHSLYHTYRGATILLTHCYFEPHFVVSRPFTLVLLNFVPRLPLSFSLPLKREIERPLFSNSSSLQTNAIGKGKREVLG